MIVLYISCRQISSRNSEVDSWRSPVFEAIEIIFLPSFEAHEVIHTCFKLVFLVAMPVCHRRKGYLVAYNGDRLQGKGRLRHIVRIYRLTTIGKARCGCEEKVSTWAGSEEKIASLHGLAYG